jgi:ABC-type uncharacterized transport system substrate-binding protein
MYFHRIQNPQWFALGAMLLALSFPADAQQPAKVWRIGVLVSSSPSLNASRDEALRQGLHEIGYVEGKNIIMEYRYAVGKLDRLSELAADLMCLKPDVILSAVPGWLLPPSKQPAQSRSSWWAPAIYDRVDFVEAGGLISYGMNLADLSRRAIWYVDQILKGAKPANLPLTEPAKFELVIDLKTAKQIGLTIPPNVRARADKVIE